ncbi:MAG TPA: universal stress protein [Thermoplasmata archaeon]|nr:universal stress protein [Thermoplasmata archaeon]
MMKNLSVAVDGSKSSEKALLAAIELGKALSASLTVISVAPLHVVPAGTATAIPIIHDAEVKIHQELLMKAHDQVALAGLKVSTVLLDGFVAEELLAYLERHPFDMLIMGARGLSAGQRFFLGSVSDAVVHHAKLPVLIVRE